MVEVVVDEKLDGRQHVEVDHRAHAGEDVLPGQQLVVVAHRLRPHLQNNPWSNRGQIVVKPASRDRRRRRGAQERAGVCLQAGELDALPPRLRQAERCELVERAARDLEAPELARLGGGGVSGCTNFGCTC